jgi:type IV secretory pathway VirB2 component (pilin)
VVAYDIIKKSNIKGRNMKITNKVKTLVAGGLGVVAMALQSAPTFAAKVRCPDGTEAKDLTNCGTKNSLNSNDLMTTLNTIINVVIGLIGFVAVIVIILGGVQYTTSAGDSSKVKKAKDTIMYGIIGLVIALMAYSIVNFILSNVFK